MQQVRFSEDILPLAPLSPAKNTAPVPSETHEWWESVPLLSRVLIRGEETAVRERKHVLLTFSLGAVALPALFYAGTGAPDGLVWGYIGLSALLSVCSLSYMAATRQAGLYFYVAVLGGWLLCLVLIDWHQASASRDRVAILFAVLLDLCLVGSVPTNVSTGFVGTMVVYMLVMLFEAAFRFGAWDIPGTADDAARRAVCECRNPPCAMGAEHIAQGLPRIIALGVDYWLTRRFAVEMARKQEAVEVAVSTADKIASCLAQFDLDAAADHLQRQHHVLPKGLRVALETLLQNLRTYRNYLPDALFPAPRERAASSPDSRYHMSESTARMPDLTSALSTDPGVPGAHSKRVAMMFTDIRQSTALWEHSAGDMEKALHSHNHIIRNAFMMHDGYEVKTIGDAFMIAYEHATEAVLAGSQIQAAFAQQDIWPPGLKRSNDGEWPAFSIRMGVHCGPVIVERNVLTDRYDYFGSTVNKAARVEAKGTASAVTVTQEVLDKVGTLLNDFIVIPYAQGCAAKGFSNLLKLTALLPNTPACVVLEAHVRRQCTAANATPTAPTKPSSESSSGPAKKVNLADVARSVLAATYIDSSDSSASEADGSEGDAPDTPPPQLQAAPSTKSLPSAPYNRVGLMLCPEEEIEVQEASEVSPLQPPTRLNKQRSIRKNAAPASLPVSATSQWVFAASGSLGVVRFDFCSDTDTGEIPWSVLEANTAEKLDSVLACVSRTQGTVASVWGASALMTWGVHAPCTQYLAQSTRALMLLHDAFAPDGVRPSLGETVPPCVFNAGLASGKLTAGNLTAGMKSFITPLGPCVELAMALSLGAAELGVDVLVGSWGGRSKDKFASNTTLAPYLRPVDVWSVAGETGVSAHGSSRPGDQHSVMIETDERSSPFLRPKSPHVVSPSDLGDVGALRGGMPTSPGGAQTHQAGLPGERLLSRKCVMVLQLNITELRAARRDYAMSEIAVPSSERGSKDDEAGSGASSSSAAPSLPLWGPAYNKAFFAQDAAAIMAAAERGHDPVLLRVAGFLASGTHLQHGFVRFRGPNDERSFASVLCREGRNFAAVIV